MAPVIGGAIGSFFAIKEISINLLYRGDVAELSDSVAFSALNLRGVDFVFCAAALAGLYAWHRLSLIEEEGTVNESAVRDQVFASMRNSFASTSALSMGMRRMTAFPYDMLRKTGRSTSSTISRAAARKGIDSYNKLPKRMD